MTIHHAPPAHGASVQTAEVVANISKVSVIYPSSNGPMTAVSEASMKLHKGEFVSILGPSGCGKSTILSTMAGLQEVSLGKITLFDQIMKGKPHKNVGVVFQRPTLLPWLTVLQNLLVPIDAMGLDKAAYMDRAHELLKLIALEKFANHYPAELSGGMQQRVGIARALIHDPGLILMDEPFSALDAMTRERMSIELQDIIGARGQTVLFITHSVPEAVHLSDRVLMMSSSPGRFIEEVVIDLPRPRGLEVMSSPRFGELCGYLRALYTH